MSDDQGGFKGSEFRRTITRALLLLLLQWFVPGGAAANCTVVDLMPAFWQALPGGDPGARMQTAVIDTHPDLNNDNFVRLPTAAMWQSKLTGEQTYDIVAAPREYSPRSWFTPIR